MAPFHPGMNRSRLLRLLERALIATGFFLLGWWFHGWNETRNFQRTASSSLEQKRAAFAALEQPGTKTRPASRTPKGTPAERSVIGRIEIPRLKISAMIVEGTTPDILDRAVGHFAATPLPGETGNVGLAGHRDTFRAAWGTFARRSGADLDPETTHR